MRNNRFTEEQITVVLKQVELGVPLGEICRKFGILKQISYRWNAKCAGISATEVCRLKRLDEENRQPKQIVADLTLDKQILQEVLNKVLKLAYLRQLVASACQASAISLHRCRGLLPGPPEHAALPEPQGDPTAQRMRMRKLAMDHPCYGYRRVHVLLRREGWHVNHKNLHRLYRAEGLARLSRRRKKRSEQIRVLSPTLLEIHPLWSMNFVGDTLADGSRFRILTVINAISRECLTLHVDLWIFAAKVTPALDRVIARRGAPGVIRVDNGTEFASNHFDAWAYERGIQVDFIHPGRPVENGLIESFNGRLRDECLNGHWFSDLDEAKRLVEVWRAHYNDVRPHSSLGYVAPAANVAELLAKGSQTA